MNLQSLLSEMKKWAPTLGAGLFLLHFSCATQQSLTTSSPGSYSEDLTVERIHFETDPKESAASEKVDEKKERQTIPTKTVNAKVDAVLDSLDKLNQFRKFVDGYTIQIYSGQNREEAISAKSKMVVEIGDLEASVQYTQPKFRVTAGRYLSRLEAQKDMLRLKRLFPNAILIPEKISVK